jgi:hypothetical protein
MGLLFNMERTAEALPWNIANVGWKIAGKTCSTQFQLKNLAKNKNVKHYET